jgi:hypothetical protein
MDRAINLKVNDRIADYLADVSNKFDCTQADFIRCCIEIGGPSVERNPDLIRLLPFHSSTSIHSK